MTRCVPALLAVLALGLGGAVATDSTEGVPPKGQLIKIAGVTWDYVKSHDCFGHDLFNKSVTPWFSQGTTAEDDRTACAEKCRTMEKCVAFNFPVLTNGWWDESTRGPKVCYMKHGFVMSDQLHVTCSSEIMSPSWDYYTLLPEEAEQKMEGPFDGDWTAKGDSSQIYDITKGTIQWGKGDQSKILDEAPTTFTTEHNGKTQKATLDGDELVWDNGDTWTRYVPKTGKFDGTWTDKTDSGAKVYTISKGTVQWSSSDKTAISQEDATFLETERDGAKTKATADGVNLVWDNGDTWIPYKPQKAAKRAAATTEDETTTTETTTTEPTTKATTTKEETTTKETTTTEEETTTKETTTTKTTTMGGLLSLSTLHGSVWTPKTVPGSMYFAIWKDNIFFLNGTTAMLAGNTSDFTIRHLAGNFWNKNKTNTTNTSGANVSANVSVSAEAFLPTVHGVLAHKGNETELDISDGSEWIRYNISSWWEGNKTGLKEHYEIPEPGDGGGFVFKNQKMMGELCLEENVTYEPLDMTGQPFTKEDNITMCKKRCAAIEECEHFAYWLPGGDCHVQDVLATKTTNRFLFISGKIGCKLEGGTNLNTSMIVEQNRACFLEGRAFMPLDSPHSLKDPLTQLTNWTTLTCQDACGSRPWCAHFTYNGQARTCHLQDENATMGTPVMSTVSGPPHCPHTASFSFDINNVSYSRLVKTESVSQFKEAIEFGIVNLQHITVSLQNANPTLKQLEESMMTLSKPEPLIGVYMTVTGDDNRTHVSMELDFKSQKDAGMVQTQLLFKRRFLVYSVLMSLQHKYDGSRNISLGVISMSDLTTLNTPNMPHYVVPSAAELMGGAGVPTQADGDLDGDVMDETQSRLELQARADLAEAKAQADQAVEIVQRDEVPSVGIAWVGKTLKTDSIMCVGFAIGLVASIGLVAGMLLGRRRCAGSRSQRRQLRNGSWDDDLEATACLMRAECAVPEADM